MRRTIAICTMLYVSVSLLTTDAMAQEKNSYRWKQQNVNYDALSKRIATPKNFKRIPIKKVSYGYFLRHLPLKRKKSAVYSYKNDLILAANHPALLAVVDLDLSKRDRQQCMDTIIRLRGEYLFSQGRGDKARFAWPTTKGFSFAQWKKGYRPVKEGRKWVFKKSRKLAHGYRSFRRYLEYLFSWTGTIHQLGEKRVSFEEMRVGDFFIQAGSPGHAVLIVDIARNEKGELALLLAQGFMPAQDMHVLKGPLAGWFPLKKGEKLYTPIWPKAFNLSELRRFRY